MARKKARSQQEEERIKLLEDTLLKAKAFKAHQAEADGEEVVDDLTDLRRSDVEPPPDPPKSRENPDQLVDIITFAEHPYYCNQKTLHPWQKLLLKLLYMGSAGNMHLKIGDSKKPKTGCDGCIWNYAKKNELKIVENWKEHQRTRMPMLPIENSPCLTCDRFGKDNREKRFEAAHHLAIKKQQKELALELELETLTDNFITEMDLLNADSDDHDPEILNQIKQKIGNYFNELVLVIGRRGGKALDVTTPILTSEGWSTMGEINPGDFVYAPDGTETKVIACTEEMNNRDCYELEFSNGDKIVADAEHEWVVLDKCERKNYARRNDKTPKPKVVTSKDVYDNLYYHRNDGRKEHNYSIELTEPIKFEERQLEIDPYILGAWLGDGTSVRAEISTADDELLDNFNSRGYHTKKLKGKYSYGFNKNGEKNSFLGPAKKLNIYNNKHIPDKYKYSSINQRLELLRGLLDTDGYIDSTNKRRVEFCTVNKKLAEDVEFLCLSLGIKTHIQTGRATLDGRYISDKYRICFTPFSDMNVFNLSRKSTLQKDIRKSDIGRVFIVDCKKVESRPVKCIQVEHESHCYLAGKYLIPTHNSFIVSIISLYECYKLIKMGNPQERYTMLEGDEISVVNVAKNEEQAKTALFKKIKAIAEASPYFMPKIGDTLEAALYLRSPADEENNKERIKKGFPPNRGTISLISGHSNAAGLVGLTSWAIIIDEISAMVGKNPEAGVDVDLYNELKPSMSTFEPDSKMIVLSNPRGPHGMLFDLYNNQRLVDNALIVQVPTWRINPTVSQEYLERERARDPVQYEMQYGAKFAAASQNPFLTKEMVEEMFYDKPQPRMEVGERLFNYYCHLDPATSSDYYAMVIAHAMPSPQEPDGDPIIYIDHIHYWEPEGKNQPISPDVCVDYVKELHSKFRFRQVSFDQWNSASAISNLQNYGINAVLKPFNKKYTELIYGNLYQLISEHRIVCYSNNTVLTENGEVKYLNEIDLAKEQLKMLQKKWNGKKFKIEALSGYHDDIPDCIAAVAQECVESKIKRPLPKTRLVDGGI
jgi:intein/homing endonuclease